MSAWCKTSLGEVLELKRGYDLSKAKRLPGPYPVISSSGPSDFHTEAKVDGPGVITGRYGTIGQVFYTEVPFWPLNTALYVRDFKGNCPRFCFYFLQTLDWSKFNDKSGVPGVNRNDAHLEPVVIPPVDEQRQIAAILGALDDKIELNRKTAATLEEMARALYRSWFVDFDPVHAKAAGRVPAHMAPQTAALFPASFGEDGLPEGWQVQPLLEVVELLSGGTPKTSVPEFWNGDIPWASAKDVSQCGKAFLITTERTITAEGLKKSSTKIIPKFSTVVVARGATTGRACMFGDDIAMNQTCYALRSRNDRPFFANCLFMTEVLGITLAAHGSVFDTITTKTLQAASVVSPCEGLSEVFEREVSPMFNRILDLTRENQTLATLRDTLLPRLMSGELRVGEAKERVEEIV
ncbi:restriction endonuclease subunit S [Leisingera sp. SS27]|uniref:restriction endonuclease subunit S n=1 Tax=Leisingera sp. SS27 TaxID=2979462 RepID=UPI00232FE330|nr:restriction endonuclease subunit S [Leisingera sp. SS27]MDC0656388.1 restriction endonuclease subunit S [Leisingera sp. SS27]